MTLISQVQIYLKDVWADGFADEATRIHTLLDRIAKPANLGDLNNYYLVKYANSQNIALGDDNIAAAQAVGSPSAAVRFAILPSIQTGEAILPITQLETSLEGNGLAFGTLIETEVDGMMDEFYTRRAFQLYRDSYGDRGQIASIASNVLTLVNPFDAANFFQNMPINASANVNGSSPRAGSTTVTAVDISVGTVTVANAGAITGLAANDYLFATTEIGQFGMEGLGLSTPVNSPVVGGGDNFRGVDRSADPMRLAGSRLTTATATGTIEQNAAKLLSYIRLTGGRSDFMTVQSERAMEVRTRLGAKVRYEPGGDATYGFSTFMIDTPQGPVKVLDDPDCPSTGFWVGRESSHEVSTLKEFVRFDETDGNWAYKKPSNNQIGVRIRSVANYRQRQPRDFGYCPVT